MRLICIEKRQVPLAAGLVLGTVWATTRLWSHLRARHTYQKALVAVDPARVQQWNRAAAYESLARSLNQKFIEANTYTKWHLSWGWHGPYFYPTKMQGNLVSATEFFHTLPEATIHNLTKVAQEGGYNLETAFSHITSGPIPWAGPSPLPPNPSYVATALGTTLRFATPFAIGYTITWCAS